MKRSPFGEYSRIIASALAVCERIYQGSMGPDEMPPGESRIAREPGAVIADMEAVLQAARERILDALEAEVRE